MDFRKFFIAGVAIFAILTGAWLSYRVMLPPPELTTATVLPVAAELPQFSLLDQDGRPIGRDAFVGQWSLVFFGFTHCPDICPLTLQVLAGARQALAESGHNPLPRIVLVSVDPERDTPAVISEYINYFGSDNVGITGDLEEIRKLTSGLGIFFEKGPIEDDAYSVNHSAVVLVIDPQGRFHALFGAPHEVDNFVHDLPIIMTSR